MEVTDCDKHPSLLRHGLNYGYKKFYCTGQVVEFNKTLELSLAKKIVENTLIRIFLFLAIFGYFWLFLAIFGYFWLFLAIFG